MPGGGGTQRLPRLIGIAAAAPLLLEGRRLKPADALAAGIIRRRGSAGEVARGGQSLGARQSERSSALGLKGFKLPGFAPQSAEGRHFFMGSWTRLHKRSAGCDLASEAILQVLHHGLERGLDAGIAIETRYFARLAASPDAKAKIRTLFVGTTDAKAMKMRPKDVPASKPARIAVIGGGVMGRGIAYVAAQAGMQVDLIDVSDDSRPQEPRRRRPQRRARCRARPAARFRCRRDGSHPARRRIMTALPQATSWWRRCSSGPI